ncbi:transglycosylase domain-containing protein [Gloeocapsa sp. PCC 73106]|uniref:transglycosylase domain-containing protein n=1 Tax=Gloeocapsa sp. PCC 73106 TaxID=102232 RepID=UPI0002ABFF78|nr:transglycosylase domain-containing protein [Gloeocapsa sp. PCC 73106]ELR99470.1 membrane carboxypeptidase (penicillin-binding protein) [Gloeocapsa sp. PCC 73106]
MSQEPLNQVSQLVQQIQQKINIVGLLLKKGAKVPELLVYEPETTQPVVYPLLGDRYLIGRSTKSCDIVIHHSVVSQIHFSLRRDPKNRRSFLLKDEGSTNGTFRGKTRIKYSSLYHGQKVSLGPEELATAVIIKLRYPRPLWMQLLRYFLYAWLASLILIILFFSWQWSKVDVYPLPANTNGPVVVYAEDGTPLSPSRQTNHQELAKLSSFSPYLPKAVIASEDSRFYWHLGVDPLGILRASIINLGKQEIAQGASTITQQVARSIFPEVGRENTARRKLKEMIVALQLEANYSKNEILKAYLNRVFLGLNNFGFEDAARFYFEKSAADLTLEEAATLVAVLPAPNSYNPVQDYDTAVLLRNRVIERMADLGMISRKEADRARRSLIEVSPKARDAFSQTLAPYFYSYILEELNTILGKNVAQEGNFIVETRLNPQLQQQAETALLATLENSSDRFGFSQGALVTLDSSTSEILTLVGGKDYSQSQFNRVTQAQRQPGSTFKIFAYAAAIAQGVSPYQTFSCAPVTWQGQRYRGCERSEGYINMYTSLAQSENAVAIRIAQTTGLEAVIAMARQLGIKSPLKASPGLVLGESEVNLLEMTGAYGAIANKGIWHLPHGIQRILDGNDCTDLGNPQTCREIYAFAEQPDISKVAISSAIANTLTQLMQGVVTEGTGRAAYLGRGEGGKTGTTDNNVDLWYIGYLPQPTLVTGIWLGNDDSKPTWGGSYQAAATWGQYLKQ